jgi:hypothetical protein
MTSRPDDNLRRVEEPHRTGTDRPLTGLLTELAQETTTLVRKEVELAKAEVWRRLRRQLPVPFRWLPEEWWLSPVFYSFFWR